MTTNPYAALAIPELIDGLQWRVPLSRFSRWRIGGPADVVATPSSVEQLQVLLRTLAEEDIRFEVIGDGSNILFDDEGFRGVIVRIGPAFSKFELGEGGRVTAGGGLWVPDFVRRVLRAGLAGTCHAVGIPGRLGGLVVMNGGSERKGIGDHLDSVTIARGAGELAVLPREECEFAYRSSVLQAHGTVVIEAQFCFPEGDRGAMRREALDKLRSRKRKFPRDLPNCGSVFLSDPAMYSEVGPPGQAIEQAGLKGMRIGAAEVSPRHANFIVNLGGASSTDVLSVIRRVREIVHQRTGFFLDCEVRHLPPDGTLRKAHVSAAEVAAASA